MSCTVVAICCYLVGKQHICLMVLCIFVGLRMTETTSNVL